MQRRTSASPFHRAPRSSAQATSSCGSNEEQIAAAPNFCTHLDHHKLAFAEILNGLPERASAAVGGGQLGRRHEDRVAALRVRVEVVDAGHQPRETVENRWDSRRQIVRPVLPDDLIERVAAAQGDLE